ncbi:MAG: SpoIID/LytB domain-containing protein [Armatimonadota bacterium]|nr:SpoIID/LytB domain-containing protein [Armatimonadota bacterium]
MDGAKTLSILIAASAAASACAERVPVVRVGLASLGAQASIRLTSDRGFAAVDPASGGRLATWKANEVVTVKAGGASVSLGSRKVSAAYFTAESPAIRLVAGSASRRYRGWIYISAAAGKLVIVNELPLESYLMGVVPCEMGSSSPSEALKAQAIAARTYTLTKIGSFAKYGYDVDDTTRCHMYRGVDVETAATNEAIRRTSNQILTYAGKPIQALYATVSGGMTADAREAFGGAGTPYLIPVVDSDAKGNPYAAHAKYFAWYFDIPRESLRAKFRERGVDFGEIENLEVIGRGPSGRAINIRLTTGQGAIDLSATLIRDAFGVDIIRSTLFEIKKTAAGYRIVGKGWGHGVGMCQSGAVGRARAGQTYSQILSVYYPGTQLVTVEGSPIAYATRGSYVERVKFLSGR